MMLRFKLTKLYRKAILVCLSIVLSSLFWSLPAGSEATPKQALIVDLDRSVPIFGIRDNVPVSAASIQNLMLAYLIFDAVEAGEVTMQTSFPVSSKLRQRDDSIFVNEQTEMAVQDLLQMMLTGGKQIPKVILAEGLAGTEEQYLRLINHKADELDLVDTNFTGLTWAQETGHTTPADVVRLAQRLIKDHERFLDFFSQRRFRFENSMHISRLLDMNVSEPNLNILGFGHHYSSSHELGALVLTQQSGRSFLLFLDGLDSFDDLSAEISALTQLARNSHPNAVMALECAYDGFNKNQNSNLQRSAIVDRKGRLLAHNELVAGSEINSGSSNPDQNSSRLYPYASTTQTFVGQINNQNCGLNGLERYFDARLKSDPAPLELSVDMDVQTVIVEEMQKTLIDWQAKAGAAVLIDVNTSEIISMVSLPIDGPTNLAIDETYEFGSSLSVFNLAVALENEVTNLSEEIDVSAPLKVGAFKIKDLFMHLGTMDPKTILSESSLIGFATLALRLEDGKQKEFMQSLGFLSYPKIELFEVSRPAYKKANWSKATTATVSYGHGIAVTALQVVNAFAAIVNGGIYRPTTILKRKDQTPAQASHRVISPETSLMMRDMLHYVVNNGTGGKAKSEIYPIGGKTGTADKPLNGTYSEDARVSSFLGAFPIDEPQYALFIVVDEPKPRKDSFGYATGGWVAAPAFKNIVERVGPLMSKE